MGCLQIFLGDRFNEQLKEIYRRALRFLLTQLGNEYAKHGEYEGEISLTPSISSPSIEIKGEPTLDEKKREMKIDIELKHELELNRKPLGNSEVHSDIHVETKFRKLAIYAENYKMT